MTPPLSLPARLRFVCTQCSRCCRHDEGYVYLSPRDLDRMHRWLGIARTTFVDRYCRWVAMFDGEHLALREQQNRDCIFWKDGGCSVYPARPIQCRAYPFWQHIVESEEGWKREREECPGIGIGPEVDRGHVAQLVAERQRAGHVTRSCNGR